MKSNKKEKMDSFWDIEHLVPPKKKSVFIASKQASFAEVSTGGSENHNSNDQNKLHFSNGNVRKTKQTYLLEQKYEDLSPLIKNVEILPLKSSYHYYEFFCKNAKAYHEIRGKECARVSFFSYVAQYSQMSKEQLNWYFWWRENVRKSIFLDTDLSYIYLYIYEIINLGDLIDTANAIKSLIEVWYHYREIYPQLNHALGEWICDYSLLNRLPICYPHRQINEKMIQACTVRELFYGFDVHDEKTVADFLLSECSGYHYRKSKFYEENKQIYDEVLPSCVARLIPFLSFWENTDTDSYKHISRVAFVGALCSYRIRRHIEVDYIPLSGGEFKALMTNIVKYAENLLRSNLGIRAKLGVLGIPQRIKSEIDSFFDGGFSNHAIFTAIRPEYENLYEGNNEEFSLEKALDIERKSWNITEELIDAFEESVPFETLSDGGEQEPPIAEISGQSDVLVFEAEKSVAEDLEPMAAFLQRISDYGVFLEAILSHDIEKQRIFCHQKGIFPGNAVDYINESAADILGDILIEESQDGYVIIEDYKELFDTEV